MPHQPVLDLMRRTMANLAFVERHSRPAGPFEVTQLINSFLGALAHSWERLKAELPGLSLADARNAGWPIPEHQGGLSQPTTLGDALRLLRNSIAHGRLTFLSDCRGEIQAIQVENYDRGKMTWRGAMPVRDMRALLERFVALVEEIEREAGLPRRTA